MDTRDVKIVEAVLQTVAQRGEEGTQLGGQVNRGEEPREGEEKQERCKACGCILPNTRPSSDNTTDGQQQQAAGDEQLVRDLKAQLPATAAQQLQQLLKRLRDDRWHAMQKAQDQRDIILALGNQIKHMKADVQALQITYVHVSQAAAILKRTFTKETTQLSHVLQKYVADLLERQRQEADGSTLQAQIKDLQQAVEDYVQRMKSQDEQITTMQEDNRQISKERDKLTILMRSREEVAAQKIKRLETELSRVQEEKKNMDLSLLKATNSLDNEKIKMGDNQKLLDDLQTTQASLHQVRCSLENAMQERDQYKDEKQRCEKDCEQKVKKLESKYSGKLQENSAKYDKEIEILQKNIDELKSTHKETIAQYMANFRKQEMVQSEKFKQRYHKAQANIRELEEEVSKMRKDLQNNEERGEKPGDEEDMKDLAQQESRGEESYKVLCETYKMEISELKRLVARECEERRDLVEERRDLIEDLEHTKGELERLRILKTDGLPLFKHDPYPAAADNNLETDRYNSFNGSKMHELSRWSSQPKLLGPTPASSSSRTTKQVVRTNLAQAVSTEDLVEEIKRKHHVLPAIARGRGVIGGVPSASSSSAAPSGEGAAYHPTKGDFKLPKPSLDYLAFRRPAAEKPQPLPLWTDQSHLAAHEQTIQADKEQVAASGGRTRNDHPGVTPGGPQVGSDPLGQAGEGRQRVTVHIPPHMSAERSFHLHVPNNTPVTPKSHPDPAPRSPAGSHSPRNKASVGGAPLVADGSGRIVPSEGPRIRDLSTSPRGRVPTTEEARQYLTQLLSKRAQGD